MRLRPVEISQRTSHAAESSRQHPPPNSRQQVLQAQGAPPPLQAGENRPPSSPDSYHRSPDSSFHYKSFHPNPCSAPASRSLSPATWLSAPTSAWVRCHGGSNQTKRFPTSMCILGVAGCRGTSLIRNRHPIGPYRRTMPRLVWRSLGGGRFLMSEVPL